MFRGTEPGGSIRSKRIGMLLASCGLAIATPAQAQLITLTDVINTLLSLDATVTLQGTQIVSLNTQVNTALLNISTLNTSVANLNTSVANIASANVQLDADLSLLEGRTTGVENGLVTVNANVAANGASITALANVNATQDGAIGQLLTNTASNAAGLVAVDARVDASDLVNVAQNNAIGQLLTDTAGNAAGLVAVDARVDASNLVNIAQDGAIGQLVTNTATNAAGLVSLDIRLDASDLINAAQDGALTTLDGLVTGHTTAIANINLVNGLQDTAISQLVSGTAANAAGLVSVNARVDLNDAVDLVQTNALQTLDTRVTGHDGLLAQHGAAITVAQQTANAAQLATDTLRGQVTAGTIGLVQQQGAGAPITIGGSTDGSVVAINGSGGDRRLAGVAAGIASNDAATMGQVAQSNQATLDAAQTYTDARMAGFNSTADFRRYLNANNQALRRDMNAAAASSSAIAGLPQPIEPGAGIASFSLGGRGSQVAFAAGIAKAFKIPHTPIVRAGAAMDARGGTLTYNAAIGFHF